jgi:hypothetical protein
MKSMEVRCAAVWSSNSVRMGEYGGAANGQVDSVGYCSIRESNSAWLGGGSRMCRSLRGAVVRGVSRENVTGRLTLNY